eukprot:g15226.t1
MELGVASLNPILELHGQEINHLVFGSTRDHVEVCVVSLLDKQSSPIAVVDYPNGFRNTFPLSRALRHSHWGRRRSRTSPQDDSDSSRLPQPEQQITALALTTDCLYCVIVYLDGFVNVVRVLEEGHGGGGGCGPATASCVPPESFYLNDVFLSNYCEDFGAPSCCCCYGVEIAADGSVTTVTEDSTSRGGPAADGGVPLERSHPPISPQSATTGAATSRAVITTSRPSASMASGTSQNTAVSSSASVFRSAPITSYRAFVGSLSGNLIALDLSKPEATVIEKFTNFPGPVLSMQLVNEASKMWLFLKVGESLLRLDVYEECADAECGSAASQTGSIRNGSSDLGVLDRNLGAQSAGSRQSAPRIKRKKLLIDIADNLKKHRRQKIKNTEVLSGLHKTGRLLVCSSPSFPLRPLMRIPLCRPAAATAVEGLGSAVGVSVGVGVAGASAPSPSGTVEQLPAPNGGGDELSTAVLATTPAAAAAEDASKVIYGTDEGAPAGTEDAKETPRETEAPTADGDSEMTETETTGVTSISTRTPTTTEAPASSSATSEVEPTAAEGFASNLSKDSSQGSSKDGIGPNGLDLIDLAMEDHFQFHVEDPVSGRDSFSDKDLTPKTNVYAPATVNPVLIRKRVLKQRGVHSKESSSGRRVQVGGGAANAFARGSKELDTSSETGTSGSTIWDEQASKQSLPPPEATPQEGPAVVADTSQTAPPEEAKASNPTPVSATGGLALAPAGVSTAATALAGTSTSSCSSAKKFGAVTDVLLLSQGSLALVISSERQGTKLLLQTAQGIRNVVIQTLLIEEPLLGCHLGPGNLNPPIEETSPSHDWGVGGRKKVAGILAPDSTWMTLCIVHTVSKIFALKASREHLRTTLEAVALDLLEQSTFGYLSNAPSPDQLYPPGSNYSSPSDHCVNFNPQTFGRNGNTNRDSSHINYNDKQRQQSFEKYLPYLCQAFAFDFDAILLSAGLMADSISMCIRVWSKRQERIIPLKILQDAWGPDADALVGSLVRELLAESSGSSRNGGCTPIAIMASDAGDCAGIGFGEQTESFQEQAEELLDEMLQFLECHWSDLSLYVLQLALYACASSKTETETLTPAPGPFAFCQSWVSEQLNFILEQHENEDGYDSFVAEVLSRAKRSLGLDLPPRERLVRGYLGVERMGQIPEQFLVLGDASFGFLPAVVLGCFVECSSLEVALGVLKELWRLVGVAAADPNSNTSWHAGEVDLESQIYSPCTVFAFALFMFLQTHVRRMEVCRNTSAGAGGGAPYPPQKHSPTDEAAGSRTVKAQKQKEVLLEVQELMVGTSGGDFSADKASLRVGGSAAKTATSAALQFEHPGTQTAEKSEAYLAEQDLQDVLESVVDMDLTIRDVWTFCANNVSSGRSKGTSKSRKRFYGGLPKLAKAYPWIWNGLPWRKSFRLQWCASLLAEAEEIGPGAGVI